MKFLFFSRPCPTTRAAKNKKKNKFLLKKHKKKIEKMRYYLKNKNV